MTAIIFFGENALKGMVSEYVKYCYHERPYEGLQNKIIEPDPEIFRNQGEAQKIAHLAGLLNHYYRENLPSRERKEAA